MFLAGSKVYSISPTKSWATAAAVFFLVNLSERIKRGLEFALTGLGFKLKQEALRRLDFKPEPGVT